MNDLYVKHRRILKLNGHHFVRTIFSYRQVAFSAREVSPSHGLANQMAARWMKRTNFFPATVSETPLNPGKGDQSLQKAGEARYKVLKGLRLYVVQMLEGKPFRVPSIHPCMPQL